ncbi:fluoride efflux transporter CrcB [Alicyclobacillus tolerans]|uniref:Fluoride-specific ion channel FluC n=2 Tax=Alicyclobacillus tolerans TaxID=90970 RepID=A0ABT9LSV5_9BACL|nr:MULTISPECIES: fluoride efflux transporter CrcB [Alicyclobacillus]MDP9727340.1 CrcB protein [Alicyclobacillus tengchongensis]SHJ52562.1 camphor resistance protein CrcB [Alicyclobacillus montanus]
MNALYVGFGGIIGALLRYWIATVMNERWTLTFPYPTLFINVSGSFLLGWFTSSLNAYFPQAGDIPMLILGVGMCGAYTTFSTFTYETLAMLREERYGAATLYVFSSLLFGLAAAALGLYGIGLSGR